MPTPRCWCLVAVLPNNKLMVVGAQTGSQDTNKVATAHYKNEQTVTALFNYIHLFCRTASFGIVRLGLPHLIDFYVFFCFFAVFDCVCLTPLKWCV